MTVFDSKIEGSVMLYEFVLKNMIHVIRCPSIKEEECQTVGIYKELIVPSVTYSLRKTVYACLVWELGKVTGCRTINPLLSLPAGLFISSTF